MNPLYAVSDEDVLAAVDEAWADDDRLLGNLISPEMVSDHCALSENRLRSRLRELADEGRIERERTLKNGTEICGVRPVEGQR